MGKMIEDLCKYYPCPVSKVRSTCDKGSKCRAYEFYKKFPEYVKLRSESGKELRYHHDLEDELGVGAMVLGDIPAIRP